MANKTDPLRPRTLDPADSLDQFFPERPLLPAGSDGRVFLVKLILIALVLCALAFLVLIPHR